MGVLEQILETNNQLVKEISEIKQELASLKEGESRKIISKNVITLRFSGKDVVNNKVASKILGLSLKQIDRLITENIVPTVGTRKKLFYAEDLIKYMNENRTSKKSKEINCSEIIGDSELKELIQLQAS